MKHWYLFVASSLVSAPLAAQSLVVTSVSPGRNALGAARAARVVVGFNQPLAAPGAPDARLHVFSAQQGGRRAGQTTTQGATLTFAPNRSFQPGERVAVTITAPDASGATRLSRSQVFEFTTAVAGGTGVFGGGTRVPTQPFVECVVAADIDGDGRPDLLLADGLSNSRTNVSVRRSTGPGTYSSGDAVEVGGDLSSLGTADVDGDGDLDLLAATGSQGYTASPPRLSVGLNDGTGRFVVQPPLDLVGRPLDLTAGDIDGDGDLDLLTATAGGLNVNLNRGDGTFERSARQRDTALERIALGDVDNDGDLDLLTAHPTAAGVCLNNGLGVFAEREAISAENRGALAVGDVDGDGDLDLLTATSRAVSVSLNNGAGQFSPGAAVDVEGGGFGYRHLALGDVDNDGDLDLLSGGGSTAGLVSVRLNNGAGVFSGGSNPEVGGYLSMPAKVLLTDADADGDLDLLAASYGNGGIAVQFNNGTGPALAAGRPAAVAPLAVYPNPARGQAWVKVPRGTAQVVLLSALGQALRTVPVSADATRVPLALAGLPAGIYVVQAGAATQRLVLE